MKFPLAMMAGMAGYIIKNKMRPAAGVAEERRAGGGRVESVPYPAARRPARSGSRIPMIDKRFPMVLMLEPLHACNLTCTGCGRIREYESTIKQKLPLEECLEAVDECGAPIVSICGGEPMIYPEIGELVAGDPGAQEAHLSSAPTACSSRSGCTSSSPIKRFFFNVHLDGMEKTHDIAVEREGVFDAAIDGIKAAKAAGFLVCTNTTVYKETDMAEIEELFEYLTQLGVDGLHDLAGLRLLGGATIARSS